MKHTKLFEEFIADENSKDLNEGIGDTLRKAGQAIKKAFNNATEYLKSVFNPDKITKIPDGPKAGKPFAMYFSIKDGNIKDQIESAYSGTEFANMGNLDMSKISESKGSRISLEWTGAPHAVVDYDINQVKDRLVGAYKRLKLYMDRGYGEERDEGGNIIKEARARVKSLFIYGAPGIGKTQLIGQVCDELGIDLITLDVQYYMPEDLVGAPDVVYTQKPVYDDSGKLITPGRGMTTQNVPERLRKAFDSENGGIVFLDELNRADGPLLTKMLNFINEGKIDSFQLPPNWLIVAAGNRKEEASNVVPLESEPAFKRRFTFVNLVPDPESWGRWGASKNKSFRQKYGRDKMMPEIFDWIMKDPSNFYVAYAESEGAYPNPAAWADAATEVMDLVDIEGLKDWRGLGVDQIKDIFREHVGLEGSNNFADYLRIIAKFTERDFQDIIENPNKARLIDDIKKDPTVRFALIKFLFNNIQRKIDEVEGKGVNLKEDAEERTKLVHMYRNIVEYFGRYQSLEELISAIREFSDANPIFRYSAPKTNPTEQEKEDLSFVNQNFTSVRSKTMEN